MGQHYVTEQECQEAYRLAQEAGDPAKLGQVAGLIATQYLATIKTPLDLEDVAQEAVLTVLSKCNNYKPDKGKAFNYVTTVVQRTFLQAFRSHRTYQEKVDRLRADLMASCPSRRGASGSPQRGH